MTSKRSPQLKNDFPASRSARSSTRASTGHQTSAGTKMKPFIYGARNGIHIIGLDQTARLFARRSTS